MNPSKARPIASQPNEHDHRKSAWMVTVSRFWLALLVLLGTFLKVTPYLDHFIPVGKKHWLYLGLLAIAILTVEAGLVARLIYRLLRHASPLLVAVVLCITSLTYFSLSPGGPQTVSVKFDPTKGGLYSAWDDDYLRYATEREIKIFGIEPRAPQSREWAIVDERTAHFTFEADSNLSNKHSEANSGGYMTFYETPCDLRKYRQLSFSAKVSDPQDCAVPDFGVGLGVDSNGREVAIYQLPSVLAYPKHGDIGGEWQSYSIDIDTLTARGRFSPSPSPESGINRYTINKVAFFVAKRNVSRCRKATLWFRDIKLEPPSPQ